MYVLKMTHRDVVEHMFQQYSTQELENEARGRHRWKAMRLTYRSLLPSSSFRFSCGSEKVQEGSLLVSFKVHGHKTI